MIVLLLLLLTIPSGTVEGEDYAIYLQGYSYDSYDGNAVWHREGVYSGNITAININQPKMSQRGANDAINDGTYNIGKEKEFRWDATPGEKPHQWYKMSPEEGDNIMFLAEYQHYDEKHDEYINYTWASNFVAESKETPPTMDEHVVRYEPIPRPVLNEKYSDDPIGPTWINISIPHFKYTSSTTNLEPTGRGTYDLLQSYAIFISSSKEEEWKYIGNSKVDPNNEYTDEPIPAANDKINPNEINTGSQYFIAEDLKPGYEYEFMVMPNFRTLDAPVNGPVWGYGGGLGDKEEKSIDNDLQNSGGGSITPFSSRRGGTVIPTESIDPPSEPRNLVACGYDTNVELKWEEPLDDGGAPIEYYRIYRDGSYYVHVSAPTTIYNDDDVLNGITYDYFVRAQNAGGTGPASNTDSATPKGPPEAPINVDAEPGINNIFISWDPPPNDGGEPIGKYFLYRGTVSGGQSYYKTISPDIHEYNDTSIGSDSYYYFLTAQNTLGESDPSQEVSAKSYTTYNITITQNSEADGWSFISPMVIPYDMDLEIILNDPVHGIDGSYDKVTYYDASIDRWASYIPGRAAHFNNINTWDHTMGLWIRMNTEDTLTIIGVEPDCTNITLYPGWNMVGYPSTLIENNGLPVEVTNIGYFDSKEEYNIGYVSNTSTFKFEPGNAYWIYNNASYPVDWTVNF